MAIKITENVQLRRLRGRCRTTIYEGGVEWAVADGTTVRECLP